MLEGEGKDTDQYLREPFEYNNKGKYKYKTFDNDNKAEIQWWTHLVEELFNNTVIIKPTNGNGNFDVQTATFCGQQGRISRTVRAILNGQPGISAGQRVLRPTDQY